ncbi:Glycine cleavage system H protein 3 [Candidatus Hydrogenisulfobacillus filiaventi]|uniref:Glycine cleavage system H protein 3 n=1 Tax=Candidatus Hydrogenisulfobacillus filiaventi TaxID=2707344 RepID=A0A6F8ZEV4_9FIRM|nr:glycine cleavage system protein H [Bacillota bacterium]CAB1128200.1 Glycine cleavage system H protein 3 [Candidatus Hydrogenisulfobacillus filiaventi]
MAEIQGCDVPESLYYDLENNVWVRPDTDDTILVGMTDPAQTLSGKILFCRPKRKGTHVTRGHSLASLESGKWAGPLVSPLDGEIVEVNQRLLEEPALLNIDPYGQAWIIRLKPDPGQSWDHLYTGDEAIRRYREIIQRDKIQCMRCS